MPRTLASLLMERVLVLTSAGYLARGRGGVLEYSESGRDWGAEMSAGMGRGGTDA